MMRGIRHTKYIRGIIVLVFFMTGALWAAVGNAEPDNFTIETVVDKTQVSVGDRIKLELFTENVGKYEVLFPEEPEQLGDFSFVESKQLKKKWYGVGRAGYEYVLTAFDTGIHVIPPITVKYRKPGEIDWQIAESEQIPIDVKSLLTKESTDIRDIKDIVGGTNGRIYVILIGILVFCAFLALGILWWKKAKQVKAMEADRKKPAHEIAYLELQKLKSLKLVEAGFINEYYVRLSDIIRRYLENRFSFRSPEMTTEEFLAALTKSPQVGKEHKDLLRYFLIQCDMVKFAKYGPTEIEVLDSFRLAGNFIDGTKKIEEEDKA